MNNGYKEIFAPEHKRAHKNGCVYEHILVAERMLGRELKDSEVVHHKDMCKTNNEESNLVVFTSVSDHTSFHNGGTMQDNGDGTFSCKVTKSICPICGLKKTREAVTCSKCRERPSKDPGKIILSKLYENESMESIGRMYGVSGNAVKKWLFKHEIR